MPRGGARKNAGRKPKQIVISHYERNMKILNDQTGKNIKFLISIRDNEKLPIKDRIKAVEIMMKKTIPDVKAYDFHIDEPEPNDSFAERIIRLRRERGLPTEMESILKKGNNQESFNMADKWKF